MYTFSSTSDSQSSTEQTSESQTSDKQMEVDSELLVPEKTNQIENTKIVNKRSFEQQGICYWYPV